MKKFRIYTILALFALSSAMAQDKRDALVELGQVLFFDDSLSNPKGQSCASCHAPRAGWTHPDSTLNQRSGVAQGVIEGRFGNRRPPTIGYLQFMPHGLPEYVKEQGTYVGGFFYDGRAFSLSDQVAGPLLHPNEMNNTPAGIVQAVIEGPGATLFQEAFGIEASNLSIESAFKNISEAISSFEKSSIFAPFHSAYDAYVLGKSNLTSAQMAGLQLFTGSKTGRPGGPAVKSAGCSSCHTVGEDTTGERDLFSSGTYHNIGIPKNSDSPYYHQNDSTTNSNGYNASGKDYIDYGLGNFLYPERSLPPGNAGDESNGKGDFLRINGKFKTPTLRNVYTRPFTDFVKSYGHNGYFKSLEQIVHFYNTRNLTTVPGEVINFTERNPYARLKGDPLWPPPEISDPATLENPTGARGLIGNLGLKPKEEANLVAFLQTLSDPL